MNAVVDLEFQRDHIAEMPAHLRCWKRVAEASLLARLRSGDQRAFTELVERHRPRMMVTATRLMRSEHDAADAVQEAFCSAHQAIHRFDGRSQLSTWLHRIVVNACLTQLRIRRRRPTCSLNDVDPESAESYRARTESMLSDESPTESASNALDLIDQLPDRYREVIMVRIVQGHDTTASSRLLQTSESVVKTRLHRARRMLRSLLD